MKQDEIITLPRSVGEQALNALESRYLVNSGAWRVQQDQAIEALRIALEQPQVEQKPETWQPIETALKGRIVLVHYKNRLGNGRTMRARYYLEDTLESDTTESGWADEGWYEESEAYEYLMPLDGDPTHWMPLPPSPSSAQDVSNISAKEDAAEASKDSRAPMPEEVISIMCKQPWLFETVQQWVRIVERYHNIGTFVQSGESSGD